MAFLTNRSAPATVGVPESTGVELTLLWENGLPNNAFAAQTLTLDLAGYDLITIEYYYPSEEMGRGLVASQSAANIEGNSIRLMIVAGISTNPYAQSRDATIQANGIKFTAGNRAGSTNNNACTPFRIYGLKGVTWTR